MKKLLITLGIVLTLSGCGEVKSEIKPSEVLCNNVPQKIKALIKNKPIDDSFTYSIQDRLFKYLDIKIKDGQVIYLDTCTHKEIRRITEDKLYSKFQALGNKAIENELNYIIMGLKGE